jgi:hypothetical protein
MSSSKDNVRCYRDTMTNNYDDSVTASEVFPVDSFRACACSLCRSGCPSGATGATGYTGATGATGATGSVASWIILSLCLVLETFTKTGLSVSIRGIKPIPSTESVDTTRREVKKV